MAAELDAPRRVAVLLATDETGRVLFVRQPAGPFAGAWLLPGGAAYESEALEETVRRELREETALEAGDLAPVGRYEVRGISPERFHFHLHVFRGRATGEPRAEEGSAVVWRAPGGEQHPTIRRVLLDAGLREEPLDAIDRSLREAGIVMRALAPAATRPRGTWRFLL